MRSSASRPCSGGGPAGRRAGVSPGVHGGAVLRARPVPRTRLDGRVSGGDGRGGAAGGRAGSGAARRARSQPPGAEVLGYGREYSPALPAGETAPLVLVFHGPGIPWGPAGAVVYFWTGV